MERRNISGRYVDNSVACAAKLGEADLAKALLAKGASDTAVDEYGLMPVDYAIKFRNQTLIDLLSDDIYRAVTELLDDGFYI